MTYARRINNAVLLTAKLPAVECNVMSSQGYMTSLVCLWNVLFLWARAVKFQVVDVFRVIAVALSCRHVFCLLNDGFPGDLHLAAKHCQGRCEIATSPGGQTPCCRAYDVSTSFNCCDAYKYFGLSTDPLVMPNQ